MNIHTEPQVIMQDGHPAFAVIPWDAYQKLLHRDETDVADDVWIPHEVVRAVALAGCSMIRAWREHLGLTQHELAEKCGISQPALARIEKPEANPRAQTLKKIAAALNITVNQLAA